MDETFRQTLANSIITDDDVQFYWRLTGTMDEDTGANCLELITEMDHHTRVFICQLHHGDVQAAVKKGYWKIKRP